MIIQTLEDALGKVVRSPQDRDLYRLVEIEDNFLHYEVRVGGPDSWMRLSRTYRSLCESDFIGATVMALNLQTGDYVEANREEGVA